MKLSISFAGQMEKLILSLVETRGITEQEAVRVLVGEALEARSSHLQSPPVTSSHLPPESPGGDSSHLEATPVTSSALNGGTIGGSSLAVSSREGEGSKRKTKRPARVEPGFDDFWAHYPNHDKRADAERAWNQTAGGRPPLDELLSRLSRQIHEKRWLGDKREFCPLAASWLRAQRWTDGSANGETFLPLAPPVFHSWMQTAIDEHPRPGPERDARIDVLVASLERQGHPLKPDEIERARRYGANGPAA